MRRRGHPATDASSATLLRLDVEAQRLLRVVANATGMSMSEITSRVIREKFGGIEATLQFKELIEARNVLLNILRS